MNFPDTNLIIRWKDPAKELPDRNYCLCVIMLKMIGEKKPVPLYAIFKRDDLRKDKSDKHLIFECFQLVESFGEVYRGDKHWKRIKAWGYIEKVIDAKTSRS